MVTINQELSIEERVKCLLGVIKEGQRLLVCTHDNPDPDSIASAYALGELFKQRRGVDYTLGYDGVLGRAENRELVRRLKIPLTRFGRIKLDDYDVLGLVDTQPEHGNHPLTPEIIEGKTMICVDHHPRHDDREDPEYADVGGDYGSTSTLLVRYLDAAKVEPSRELASALFYGIKSDTRDLGRESSDDDVWAYSHLVQFADMPLISAIEHPKLPRAYFSLFARAIQRAHVTDSVVHCDIGTTYIPDMIPEVADHLASAEGVRWSVVVGEHEGQLVTSMRVNDKRFSAGKLMKDVMRHFENGSGGGHSSMAGGRVPLTHLQSPASRTKARKRFLKATLSAIGALGPAERFAPNVDASQLNIAGQPKNS